MTTVDAAGVCINAGHETAHAGISAYFGPGDQRNFRGKLKGRLQTARRAELQSIRRAILRFKTPRDGIGPTTGLTIRTTSQFAFNSINSNRQQQTDAENINSGRVPEEVVDDVLCTVKEIDSCDFDVELELVSTHIKPLGMEMAVIAATNVISD